MIYPTALPKTKIRYVEAVFPVSPGIEMKVTPDRVAPVIPNATRYHGDFLFPVKKLVLVIFLVVMLDIPINNKKYVISMIITRVGLML